MHRTVGCAILSVLLCGCFTAPRGTPDVDSDDPALKIPAIGQAVEKKDFSDVSRMVRDLDSDDSAVRFYAIEGLERLTGETFGYKYYDDEEQRQPALKRWNQWLAEREK